MPFEVEEDPTLLDERQEEGALLARRVLHLYFQPLCHPLALIAATSILLVVVAAAAAAVDSQNDAAANYVVLLRPPHPVGAVADIGRDAVCDALSVNAAVPHEGLVAVLTLEQPHEVQQVAQLSVQLHQTLG